MATAKNKTAAKAAETVGAAMAAGQETFETAIQAGAEAFKGYEDVAGYGKDSAAATMKILGCKSVTDVIDVQTELARAGYAKAIEDSRRIADISVKLAEEAAQPLAQQASATVEKFSKPIAA